MNENNIYKQMEERTRGDIYIGVVGPVRTGKSTFIKRFMDTLVIPNISDSYMKERALDELPQSAAGRTIMTTEPKFIPEDAVKIELPGNASFNVRMIDCVGYIVPSSLGYIENEQPRMVNTPWYDHEIPFNMAAEIGTRKVISEHSTIGLVITTDGSISEIPRGEYEEAEERVINELRELDKPFIVLLNCLYPAADSAKQTAAELGEKYGVPVIPVNCLYMDEAEIKSILTAVMFRFPVREITLELPDWMTSLDKEHSLRKEILTSVRAASETLGCVGDVSLFCNSVEQSECIESVSISEIDLGTGSAKVKATVSDGLFFSVLSEMTGLCVDCEQGLMSCLIELAKLKKEYEKIKDALDEVEATGYGIVMPGIDELTLMEPEIVKQGGRYGVRLSASAPSIHMLKANIKTEVAPVVGTESQSEELVSYMLREFEEDPSKIWESNIFGKSLHELVNEGLRNKLYHMPVEARGKLQETLEKVINEGCSGLICIIL